MSFFGSEQLRDQAGQKTLSKLPHPCILAMAPFYFPDYCSYSRICASEKLKLGALDEKEMWHLSL